MVADVRRLRSRRTGVLSNTRTVQAAPPGAAAAWAHASWDKAPEMSLHAVLSSEDEALLDITL
jgi:hypothetical protein